MLSNRHFPLKEASVTPKTHTSPLAGCSQLSEPHQIFGACCTYLRLAAPALLDVPPACLVEKSSIFSSLLYRGSFFLNTS